MIRVLIPGRVGVSVFSKMPSPGLGPIHSPIRWVLGIFSRGVKWQCVKYPLTCPSVKSKNESALLLLLDTFMVWAGVSLTFYLTTCNG